MTTTWDTNDKELPASPTMNDFEYDYRQTNFVPVGTAKSSNYAHPIDRSPQKGQRQQTRHATDSMDEIPRQARPTRPADAPRLQSAFSRPAAKQPLRRPSSPQKQEQPSVRPDLGQQEELADEYTSRPSNAQDPAGHLRDGSQNSWLDPIDESAGSSSSSAPSQASSNGYRQKHLRETSGNTETEFDTALDAAIEAAYDEGYEPMDPREYDSADRTDEIVSKALRKVEQARERVRQTELEAYGETTHRPKPPGHGGRHKSGGFYDDLSSDEEERLLEEMTRDYAIEDFIMTGEKPASVPHGQEMLMPRAAADQGLNKPQPKLPAAAKANRLPAPTHLSKSSQPSLPPPMQELPELPAPRPLSPGQRPASPGQTVRNRRLSGQNPKQLKIQTTKLKPPSLEPALSSSEDLARVRSPSGPEVDQAPRTVRRVTPPTANDGSHLGSPPSARSGLDGEDFAGRSGSPTIHRLRKNFSSSSLKSISRRNLSMSNGDDGSDMSPATPSTLSFATGRIPNLPALPTPLAASLRDQMEGVPTGGLYLLDDNLHRPDTPGSPNSAAIDPPAALEPCPNDVMLRPFWLMRCLYQTLAHPRGGYLSTKLFVPRDVWRVKGAKLKNVEEKISNCDLLSAALLKLAKVDTCDADAVLEEMQSLEAILEQVQVALTRKLGSEVGVQGSGVLFKEAANVLDADAASGVPRTSSVSAKSSFSWRRLRSKNSSIGLGGSFNNQRAGAEAIKDTPTMPTLPMVPQPTSRPPKRDVTQVQFVGPNAHYMSSLARLFDAAQAIGK